MKGQLIACLVSSKSYSYSYLFINESYFTSCFKELSYFVNNVLFGITLVLPLSCSSQILNDHLIKSPSFLRSIAFMLKEK